MGITIWSDLTETATSKYTKEGWSAVRVFLFDGVDMSDPTSTIQTVMNSFDCPARGDAHPSGEDMQADEILADAMSSNQIKITVSYRKLSAIDQEPDDSVPALLTCGSSVQTQNDVTTDYNGDPLTVTYATADGSTPRYQIINTLAASDPNDPTQQGVISNPQNVATGSIQIPNTSFRFARREPNDPTDKIAAYQAMTNASPMTIGAIVCEAETLLMIRIEGVTHDNGTSYVVEYEMQYNPDTWELDAVYTLPTGAQGQDTTSANNVLGAGDIPEDATIQSFQVYGTAEFNNLALV